MNTGHIGVYYLLVWNWYVIIQQTCVHVLLYTWWLSLIAKYFYLFRTIYFNWQTKIVYYYHAYYAVLKYVYILEGLSKANEHMHCLTGIFESNYKFDASSLLLMIFHFVNYSHCVVQHISWTQSSSNWTLSFDWHFPQTPTFPVTTIPHLASVSSPV